MDVFRQKEAGSAVGAGLAPARADAAVIRILREFELSQEQLALRFFEEARLRLARAGASRGRPAPPLLKILLWKRLRALKFQLRENFGSGGRGIVSFLRSAIFGNDNDALRLSVAAMRLSVILLGFRS